MQLVFIHLQAFNLPFRNLPASRQHSSVHHLTYRCWRADRRASSFHAILMAAHLKQISLIAELLRTRGPGDGAIKAL